MNADELRTRLLAIDLPTEVVDVDGEKVHVQGLTNAEKDAMVADAPEGGQLTNLTARLVVRCVVDEDGNRVFTDADIPTIAAQGAGMWKDVYDAATRLSGWGAEDEGLPTSQDEPSLTG